VPLSVTLGFPKDSRCESTPTGCPAVLPLRSTVPSLPSLGLVLGLRFEIILFLDGPRSGFRFPLGEYANRQLHYPTAGAEKIIRGQGSLCFSCIWQRSRWSWTGYSRPMNSWKWREERRIVLHAGAAHEEVSHMSGPAPMLIGLWRSGRGLMA
jgi:hypothetical protein